MAQAKAKKTSSEIAELDKIVLEIIGASKTPIRAFVLQTKVNVRKR